MAALLVAMSVLAVMMTVAMPVWKQAALREKEEELVFRGEQYARAVGLFQRKYANAFPPNLDVLVEQRFLRKKYKDPVTNDDFAPLMQGQVAGNTPGSGSLTAAQPGQVATQPQRGQPQRGQPPQAPGRAGGPVGPGPTGGAPVGGLIGVTSKSKEKSIRIYKGRTHYNEWAFVYTPVNNTPGGGGAGAATPGAGPNQGRGGRGGNQQQPTNPNSPFPGGVQRGGPPGAPPRQGGPNPQGPNPGGNRNNSPFGNPFPGPSRGR